VGNTVRNAMGVEFEAPDYVGATHAGAKRYSGMSGQRLTLSKSNQGRWISSTFNSTQFSMDIELMQKVRWIDPQTAMVQVMCFANNPSADQYITAFYTVEFCHSGLIRADIPRYRVHSLTEMAVDFTSAPYYALIFFFYYLDEELDQVYTEGYIKYACWGDLTDIICITTSLTMYVTMGFVISVMPSWAEEDMFSLLSYEAAIDAHQRSAAFFMIFLSIKGIKFTWNIPVMATIGKTFSSALVQLGLFCIVLMMLLLGFSLAFNVMFCTNTDEFATMSVSIVTVFLGLTGSMDPGPMFKTEPICGPLLYAAYIFAVLFTALTIVIAIISDAFEDAKKDHVPDGVVKRLAEYIHLLEPLEALSGEEQEPDPPAHGATEPVDLDPVSNSTQAPTEYQMASLRGEVLREFSALTSEIGLMRKEFSLLRQEVAENKPKRKTRTVLDNSVMPGSSADEVQQAPII